MSVGLLSVQSLLGQASSTCHFHHVPSQETLAVGTQQAEGRARWEDWRENQDPRRSLCCVFPHEDGQPPFPVTADQQGLGCMWRWDMGVLQARPCLEEREWGLESSTHTSPAIILFFSPPAALGKCLGGRTPPTQEDIGL